MTEGNCFWYVTYGIDGGAQGWAMVDTEKPWFPIMQIKRKLEDKHRLNVVIYDWRLLSDTQVLEIKEAARGTGSNAR